MHPAVLSADKSEILRLYNINQVYSAQGLTGEYIEQSRLFNMHQALGMSCHSLQSYTVMFLPAGSLSENSVHVCEYSLRMKKNVSIYISLYIHFPLR